MIVWRLSTAVPLLQFSSEFLEFKMHSFKDTRCVVDTVFNVGNIYVASNDMLKNY